MDAPRWPQGSLIHEQIRCICRVENVVVYPDLWYPHQQTKDVEFNCVACGRGLLPLLLPVGIEPRLFDFLALPKELLSRVQSELAVEVREHPEWKPVPWVEGPWDHPHAAPPEYVEWVSRRPKPVRRPTGILWILLLVGLVSGLTWWVVQQ